MWVKYASSRCWRRPRSPFWEGSFWGASKKKFISKRSITRSSSKASLAEKPSRFSFISIDHQENQKGRSRSSQGSPQDHQNQKSFTFISKGLIGRSHDHSPSCHLQRSRQGSCSSQGSASIELNQMLILENDRCGWVLPNEILRIDFEANALK